MSIKDLKFLFERIWGRVLGEKKTSDDRYAWYVRRKMSNRYMQNELMTYYNTSSETVKNERKLVVCPYLGACKQGGLTDRLRGIISTYSVCKQLNVDFGLVFTHPFNLSDYLVPNSYDWSANSSYIKFDIPKNNILMLDTILGTKYEKRKQRCWLSRKIEKAKGQVHVYTNASFSYDMNYDKLFSELFKPSNRLQEAINRQLSFIGESYISISCRFLDLLGDFNETYGYRKQLSEDEKEALLKEIDAQIERIHMDHPGKRILCNSDSNTFLSRVSRYNYTYVIPGIVTHIDSGCSNDDYLFYEKTFLDFFMIAHADYVYTLKFGKMYNTGYPYAASRIYNKPYSVITS